MDVFLRAIAILVEVLILTAVIYVLVAGVRLTVFDLGLGSKYKNIVTMVLIMVGGMAVVFFIAHLISLYPQVSVG